MKSFLIPALLLFCLLGIPWFVESRSQEAKDVELLEHSWKLDEDWVKIGKTKYSWSALVRNNTLQRQRVWVYYSLLDKTGGPLARTVTNQRMAPNQTLNIESDSYIDTTLKFRVDSSRAVIKSRPLPD